MDLDEPRRLGVRGSNAAASRSSSCDLVEHAQADGRGELELERLLDAAPARARGGASSGRSAAPPSPCRGGTKLDAHLARLQDLDQLVGEDAPPELVVDADAPRLLLELGEVVALACRKSVTSSNGE